MRRSLSLAAALVVTLSGSVAVTQPAAHAASPGINGRIVFVSDRDGDLEIFSMDQFGGDVQQLTHNSVADQSPEVSPAGGAIAWMSDGDIWEMDMSGLNPNQVTSNPAFEFSPTWIAGSRVAFVRTTPAGSDLFSRLFNGTDQRRITHDAGFEGPTTVSFSSHRIAFGYGSGSDNIIVMKTNGTHRHAIGVHGFPADWSPNGTRIMMDKFVGGELDTFSVNANGLGLIPLRTGPGAQGYGSFSPDGFSAVVQDDSGGDAEIVSFTLSGFSTANLTNNPAYDGQPSWGVFGP